MNSDLISQNRLSYTRKGQILHVLKKKKRGIIGGGEGMSPNQIRENQTNTGPMKSWLLEQER